MATRYVGKGGSDANNGTTWALRKLTVAAIEALAAAGDTIYIGPGEYREEFVSTINGGAGTEIVFIGDVTGEHTDGVGGFIRITASNNNSSSTRAQAASCAHDYRTFRGIIFDGGTVQVFDGLGADHLILEDCCIAYSSGGDGLVLPKGASFANIVRRCYFVGNRIHIRCEPASNTNVTHNIFNCIFIGGNRGLLFVNAGGIDCSQCLFIGLINGINVSGNTNDLSVLNCIFMGCSTAIVAGATSECTEDWNDYYSNGTNLTNVNAGANTSTAAPYFEFPMLLDDYRFPWLPYALAENSVLTSVAGSGEQAYDFFGMSRPATGQRSRGPIQYPDVQKDVVTVLAGSAALRLSNAARLQMFVPVSAVSTTFSIYVYREANYAGTLPQMVIRQPGQADVTVTDTGSSGAWNLLTTTLTPAVDPEYVVVELVSNNTAALSNVSAYFDSLSVT